MDFTTGAMEWKQSINTFVTAVISVMHFSLLMKEHHCFLHRYNRFNVFPGFPFIFNIFIDIQEVYLLRVFKELTNVPQVFVMQYRSFTNISFLNLRYFVHILNLLFTEKLAMLLWSKIFVETLFPIYFF